MKEATISGVITALKQVRVVNPDQTPYVGELRMQYYDGYVQKAKKMIEIVVNDQTK